MPRVAGSFFGVVHDLKWSRATWVARDYLYVVSLDPKTGRKSYNEIVLKERIPQTWELLGGAISTDASSNVLFDTHEARRKIMLLSVDTTRNRSDTHMEAQAMDFSAWRVPQHPILGYNPKDWAGSTPTNFECWTAQLPGGKLRNFTRHPHWAGPFSTLQCEEMSLLKNGRKYSYTRPTRSHEIPAGDQLFDVHPTLGDRVLLRDKDGLYRVLRMLPRTWREEPGPDPSNTPAGYRPTASVRPIWTRLGQRWVSDQDFNAFEFCDGELFISGGKL